MAHGKLRAQHGDVTCPPLNCEPDWYSNKEPVFEPEYFSGLNWRDAEKLMGKMVEFSDDPDEYGWIKGVLVEIDKEFSSRFESTSESYEYIRTCPETYARPPVTIGGGKLPRPEVRAPEKGTAYWIFDLVEVVELIWLGTETDHMWLTDAKVVHLTEARAQEWADWWENTVLAAVK